MSADSDSRIAWHRVQLKKNREALKALEAGRFTTAEVAGRRHASQSIDELKAKIAESEHCIALHDRGSRRPMATDFRSLTGVNWSSWTGGGNDR